MRASLGRRLNRLIGIPGALARAVRAVSVVASEVAETNIVATLAVCYSAFNANICNFD